MGTRVYQWEVVRDPRFIGAIEASVMKIASEVLVEPAATPNTANRKAAAAKIMRGLGSTKERMLRLFAWVAVFDPTIAQQVFNAETKAITPENVDDATLDALVRNFWTTASNFEQV